MTNDIVRNFIHDVAIDWLMENPKIDGGETVIENLLAATLSSIKKTYKSDKSEVEKSVSRISSDIRLTCRQLFADRNFVTADTACCIVLATSAWLVFHLRKSVATEYAMLLFGKAADIAPEYYDSHDFLELLGDYEENAIGIMTDILADDNNAKVLRLTNKKTELEESKRPIYNINCETGSSPSFYNDSTFRAEGDLVTTAK